METEWEIEYVGGFGEVKVAIGRREEEEWRQKVNGKPRLRTYKLIKDKLEFGGLEGQR